MKSRVASSMNKEEAKQKIADLKSDNEAKMKSIYTLCAQVKQLRHEIEDNERMIEEYEGVE